jgi:spore coat protein U-like protein
MLRCQFLGIRAAAALVLLAPASLVCAAVPTTNATGTAMVLRPVSVIKLKDMNFGYVTSAAAGTAVLEPNADTLTTTGGVSPVGGAPHSAEFAGSATTSSIVNIKVPNQPSTLTRVGGTQTMTVSNFTLQGQNKRTIAAQTFFTFRVGGRLNVAANQAEGTYAGTFTVTVQYP